MFTHHLKSHAESKNETLKKQQKCPLCNFKCSFEKDIIINFKGKHDIDVKQETLNFNTFEEFEIWKYGIENETDSRFITLRSRSLSSGKYIKYVCNRSGYYSPSVQNRTRYLKTQGTNKINSFCPAAMILQITESGKCTCKFTKSHIGHSNDLGHIYLSPLERKMCAEKIASKVAFSDILDQVRDSVCDSKLDRLHLLTRKDLNNIEKSYNLCSEAVRHQNDATSVEAWVNEMKQEDNMCVLFYKPQDTVVEEHCELKKDDFILIIMNQAQCEILKKFGSDCICPDSTHGMNTFDFQLTTLMIIDDMRQGFPCAFLISNRVDKEVLKVLFSHIRMYSNVITPHVFMTDIAESFYNAWVDIMGKPVMRLYCSWHIDQAWRKNLVKIRIRDKQIEVYKFLRTIMEERDVTAFSKMIDEFL
ncbi:uncharacterized protein [Diabrotica undecimpunctata]|uniref:uncharacterized protein n=1 Tax=Diabrotica undecimpunctata TaxID=50387 RepID=UPI003B637B99